jgi:tripartite ATP-independent transporter DctM subunit
MDPVTVALIIIVSLVVCIFTGVPIAFVLTGLSAGLMLIFLGPSGLYMVVGSAFSQMTTEVYISIPLFVLMAVVFQQSGIAAQLYKAMHMWMGPVRGGLAIGTVLICAVIAALSGVGATGTITMGLIALPEMIKRGYDRQMVLGAITSGGSLGAIIPPSVLMIVVGGYAQLSVGKMFIGGVLPGFIITAGYCLYILIKCFLNREAGPALPKEEQGTFKDKIVALRYVILPLLMIVFLMGGIYSGAFTPTEAAGFGALSAVVIAAAQKQLSVAKIIEACRSSFTVSCMIMWLLIGGGCYSALVTVTGTGTLVSGLLSNLGGASVAVILMIVIVLILGMFIDSIAISLICIPIFVPVLTQFAIDPLWFMLLFVVAAVTGFLTPPFGVNLFYMKGIVGDDVPMAEIYKGTFPYIVSNFIALILCFLFPSILTYLPNLMG